MIGPDIPFPNQEDPNTRALKEIARTLTAHNQSQMHEIGTYQSLGRTEERAHYLATACLEYTIELCRGAFG